jgi:hypothetical protein
MGCRHSGRREHERERAVDSSRLGAYTVRVQWSSSVATGLVVQYSCGRFPVYQSEDWWVVTVAPTRGSDSVAVHFVSSEHVEGEMASCSTVPMPMPSTTFVVFRCVRVRVRVSIPLSVVVYTS